MLNTVTSGVGQWFIRGKGVVDPGVARGMDRDVEPQTVRSSAECAEILAQVVHVASVKPRSGADP